MKNTILWLVLLMIVIFVASCKEKTTEPVVVADLELNGTWNGIDTTHGVSFEITISNSALDIMVFPDELQKANVISYNNESNTMIVFWAMHPGNEILNKYMKINWLGVTSTMATLKFSPPLNTQAEAESSLDNGDWAIVQLTKSEVSACANPSFTPGTGQYTSAQSVSISCSTTGATIRYTTNGSDPTSSSTMYSSPISISITTTVKAKAFKSGWNDSAIASATYTIETSPGDMVLVAGGTFNNGISNVTVSSFYMDKYELTQAGYQAVMGSNPASGYGVGSNYPVYYVSWFKAIEYCNRRSITEGLTPCYSYLTYGTNPDTWPVGWNTSDANHTNVSCNWTANGYRLPTEAEWQFAARGGNQSNNYTYSGSNDINAVAWYASNSGSTTHTVGTKTANELGLFDMSGNVYEWNWDIYGSYPSGSQTNPTGAASGSHRVVRGGGWNYYADCCPVSARADRSATYSNYDLGFRCVRVSP